MEQQCVCKGIERVEKERVNYFAQFQVWFVGSCLVFSVHERQGATGESSVEAVKTLRGLEHLMSEGSSSGSEQAITNM